MAERIFALDIGTRSVVGLLIEKVNNKYHLIDYYSVEHQERSMLDGQIHDVVSVATVINEVKERLEEKHNIVLSRVCVAAAGRALKTKRKEITKNISQQPLMEREDILYLELSAVQEAQYELANEEINTSSAHYYCVGYSVLQYQLDGEEIGSLIDQQGDTAQVEIIATFLPKVVVESLISALTRAELEMEALTLEPIAAINVLIPQSMRRLNVALVDIGAGTSDIALTADGTITAYGMVPMAGDEITEAISDQYLLDFNQAEDVKRQITETRQATFSDILGFEQTIEYEELVEAISDSINSLVDSIAKEIFLLNNIAPKAVMLVGGGSLTPELSSRLAEKLHLPANRVAIRSVDAIPSIEKADHLPTGPEYITPIGIAIAAKQNPVHYISVTVNNRSVRLFDMKQLTVGDCLLASGINIERLYGRPGMAYMVSWNGKDITLPGSYGTAPTVKLNGQEVTVDISIKHGDILEVEKGINGEEPQITLKELIGDATSYQVWFNGEQHELKPTIFVNNQVSYPDYVVQDHDSIRMVSSHSLKNFLNLTKNDQLLENFGTFQIWINGEQKVFSDYSITILINNKNANLETQLKHNDRITVKTPEYPTLQLLLDKLGLQADYSMPINYNGKLIELKKPLVSVYKDGLLLNVDDSIHPFDKLQLKKLDRTPFIFQDLFRFISLDLSKIKGKVEISRNGEDTTFFEELNPNDQIRIEWEDKSK
ncbi:cell division protein FtsA [Aquibacillus kalidii]|uniref:cell division protein FtsA n=1 Tax=Aquibacillus kalidii TaxID=2762597 RepID=UPI001648FCA3|nr:cell division protein FtsA [Aquibacillus kalidii]